MRPGIRATIALLASALTLGAASAAHYVYSAERFDEGAPGQWLADDAGYLWRFDSWSVQQEDNGKVPAPGAVFVVATLSVRIPPDVSPTFGCYVRLVGHDDAQWTTYIWSEDTASNICGEASPGGEPVSGTLPFEVPAIWATPERIWGISFYPKSGFDARPLLTTANEG